MEWPAKGVESRVRLSLLTAFWQYSLFSVDQPAVKNLKCNFQLLCASGRCVEDKNKAGVLFVVIRSPTSRPDPLKKQKDFPHLCCCRHNTAAHRLPTLGHRLIQFSGTFLSLSRRREPPGPLMNHLSVKDHPTFFLEIFF